MALSEWFCTSSVLLPLAGYLTFDLFQILRCAIMIEKLLFVTKGFVIILTIFFTKDFFCLITISKNDKFTLCKNGTFFTA